MIKITIYKNQNDLYTGFDSIGHAGYAEHGEDIICAGVSALVINTINSILTFTDDSFDTTTEEDSGMITFHSKGNKISKDSNLLIKSLVLGLQGIQNNYGNEYIMLIFKEV